MVVCDGDRLVGLVPVHRLLTASGSEEPIARRFWHRLPWLLLGLAGVLLAAGIVARFERSLVANVELAFFITGIVYMADAVGTQTETLIVRGLSIGVPVRDVVRRELMTGALMGIVLAAAFAVVGLPIWHRPEVVLAVALALLAACSTATIVAMALPWFLHRLGAAPAFGSGPLSTVIQDLLSIIIYFSIATALVG